jgi:hypothetical protein
MMNDEQHTQPLSDNFDVFLRERLQHNQPYLDDGDFSAKVMATLPAPRRLSPWQERLIVLGPLAIIILLILSQFSLASGIKAWYLFLSLDFASLLGLGVLLAVTAVSAASYWIAKQTRII